MATSTSTSTSAASPAASLTQEDLKALEQTRQRLFQLTNNIASLRSDVARGNPLPQWSSLQTSASILVTNIQTLTTHLANNADSLNRIVVYPATNYPGRTQEALLGQLLRKKLEPAVETVVEGGRAVQAGAGAGDVHAQPEDADEERWEGAADWVRQRIAEYIHSEIPDNFTAEERREGVDNVRTGLRRKLDKKKPKTLQEEEEDDEDDEDDDEDEDENEDDEMEGVDVTADVTATQATSGLRQAGFGMGLAKKNPNGRPRTEDDILRFATSGTVTDQQSDLR